MGKNRILKLAILPAILIGLIVYLIATTQTSTVKVVVAKKQINAGTILTRNDVEYKDLPAAFVSEEAIRNIDDTVGKRLTVARIQGDILYKSILTDKGITIDENSVIFSISIPKQLSCYVSENTKLSVVGLSSATNVPPQVFTDIIVVAIVSSASSNDITAPNDSVRVIVKTSKDTWVALAPFIKSNSYQVSVQ